MISLLVLSSALASTIVVDFEDTTSKRDLDALIASSHLTDTRYVDVSTMDERLILGEGDESTLAALLASPFVEAAEMQVEFSALGMFTSSSNDPDLQKQWHMTHSSIDAPWVWSHTSSGSGIVVAVLDTGIALTKDMNPDQVLKGKSFIPRQEVNDLHGHGSHCAATIAQWTDNGFAAAGLAKNATILPVKVLSNEGSGSSEGIAAGIYYAIEQHADVISMSLGSSMPSPVINEAIDDAIEAGVIVVAAAGNSGDWGDDSVGWPGKHPPVISVGAIGPDSKRSPYSSYGEGLDIMAPGGNTRIKGGGVFQYIRYEGREQLAEFQGTSMATPHVAAAVAVLLGEGAPHNQDDMMKLLASTATANSNKSEYGEGIIDLKAALTKVGKSPGLPLPAGLAQSGLLAIASVLLVMGLQLRGVARDFVVKASLAAGAAALLPVLLAGVPLMGLPDLVVPGLAGFPLLASAAPFLPLFLVGAPSKTLRPILMGLLAYGTVYMAANAVLAFAPVWWLTGVGATVWFGLNAVVLLAAMFTVTKWIDLKK